MYVSELILSFSDRNQIHMGLENPIKIAYHHPTKSFGVGCVKHIVDELTGPFGSRPATGSSSCFKILSAADYSSQCKVSAYIKF